MEEFFRKSGLILILLLLISGCGAEEIAEEEPIKQIAEEENVEFYLEDNLDDSLEELDMLKES